MDKGESAIHVLGASESVIHCTVGSLLSRLRNSSRLELKLTASNVLPRRHIQIIQKVSLPKISLYPTGDEVLEGLNLKGKLSLITGANSGIGFEMAKSLARRGCDVNLACRNAYAAYGAVGRIGPVEGTISVVQLDLSSLESVKMCSDEILSTKRKLDIVILNAGTFGIPFTLTEDGIEATFQVNHLSQFYLLLNLERMLAPGARVVSISSWSHRNVSRDMLNSMITEEMLNMPKTKYSDVKAYNISKLCNILAVRYLARRWAEKPLLAFAADPGSFVKTKLCRNSWAYKLLYTSMIPFSKNVAQSSSTPLYCATSLELSKNSALFYNNCKPCKESELASNSSIAFRVYDICINMLSMRLVLPSSVQHETEPDSIVTPIKHEGDTPVPAFN